MLLILSPCSFHIMTVVGVIASRLTHNVRWDCADAIGFIVCSFIARALLLSWIMTVVYWKATLGLRDRCIVALMSSVGLRSSCTGLVVLSVLSFLRTDSFSMTWLHSSMNRFLAFVYGSCPPVSEWLQTTHHVRQLHAHLLTQVTVT